MPESRTRPAHTRESTAVVHEYDDDRDRFTHIRLLIAVVEQQIAEDCFNEPMKPRLRQYRRWLRELESA